MNGFKTSRALIIDDVPTEAMPIVHAFGNLGIGSIYHDAGPEADYSTKHAGVRLLVLDMILENRGATEGDPTAAVSVLMGALSEIIDDSPGVVVIVCWTKHKDVIKPFTEAFRVSFPNIILAEVILFEKHLLADVAKRKDLIEQIRVALSRYEPASLLLGWEQIVHQAATRTTRAIYESAQVYAREAGKTWGEGAFLACAALAVAERGTRLEDEPPSFSVKALSDALGPILLDRIESRDVNDIEAPADIAAKLFESVKNSINSKEPLLPAALRADLNTKVNISYHIPTGEACPGAIYLLGTNELNDKISEFFFWEWAEVKADTLSGAPGDTAKSLLVEISPSCDFAQSKGKVPKLIAGLLLPKSGTTKAKKAPFIRNVGSFKIVTDDVTDVYELVLNARFMISLPLGLITHMTAKMRLRSAILADIIAWHAAYSGRPGFVSL